MDDLPGSQAWLERHSEIPYAYPTTIGRRTGRPHRIEIWFAAQGGHIYLMSGGRDRSDWVRTILASPNITIELGNETHVGTATIVTPDAPGEHQARELLTANDAAPGNQLAN